MRFLLSFASAPCLYPLCSYPIIAETQQLPKISFSYVGGVAIATLATFDSSLGSTINSFIVNLAADNQFQLIITAPAGMDFVAQTPTQARLFINYLSFNNPNFKNGLETATPVITYTGFVGSGGTYSGGDTFSSPANASNLGLGVSTDIFSSSFRS